MGDAKRQHPSWRMLIMIGVTLMAVFAGAAYLQFRQSQILSGALQYQDDNIAWSYFQLETEQMRLQTALHDAQHGLLTPDQLQQRYDIFISRVGIVRGGLYRSLLQALPEYQRMQTQLDAFIRQGDASLENRASLPDKAELARLEHQLEQLNGGLHDLSLQANQAVAERVDSRNRTMLQQIAIGNWLMGFEWVLILGFGLIVIRQLRQLEGRRLALESLTVSLEEARSQAEAGSQAKSAFLANMSHEIRTPLNGVLGMLSLLADDAPRPSQASYIATADASARHLLLLLNDVLDASKLESGKLELAPVTCNLGYLLRQIVNLMAAQAQAKQLMLNLELASEIPEWVELDPTRLRQILLNLLSNAIKFTERGGVTVSASSSPGAAGGDASLLLMIADTGIGMDPTTMARLFKRFSQGDGSIARHFGGSGLGLEISQSLALLMGGRITATSVQGQGSCFQLALPLKLSAAPQLPATGQAATLFPDLCQPLRILVVDDNAVNRKYMQALLERMNQMPVLAEDGPQALETAAAQPFDLVLMDLHMPGMDGLEAARRLRLQSKATQPRIIALTADAFPETRQRVLDNGLDDFLSKPLSREQLLATLQRHFPPRPDSPPLPLEPPLLDAQAIADFVSLLSEGTYRELAEQYFSGHEATILRLNAELPPEPETLFHLAHSLKGGAVTLGFTSLAQRCLRLEQEAIRGDGPPLQAAAQTVTAFKETRAACMDQGYLFPATH
ncbi:hybrid sensor histidine kinase/response regulator [Chromobacterium sp. ATCC 53434]|uniref:response regulator n=1 Tax=Chromobacterium TaxID=535 RepID=UPI000C75850C|nr:response regulator [Chromobacterium sp. ATCC 53434]AUH50939.1 hybrid sensor histidine kinase/response regulator [Chromobacterium sp. ATCC 53434]